MNPEKHNPEFQAPTDEQSERERLTKELLAIVETEHKPAEVDSEPVFSPEYNHEIGSLSVKVEGLDTPASTMDAAKAAGFEPKEELHVTVLRAKVGKSILKGLRNLPAEEAVAKQAQIHKLWRGTDFSFTLRDERYSLTEDIATPVKGSSEPHVEHRESIVQMVDMPGAANFFSRLSEIVGTEIEPPPLHVTLATKGSDPEKSRLGIGINSAADLNRLQARPFLAA